MNDDVPASGESTNVETNKSRQPVKPMLWRSRRTSMPYIPGGASQQIEGLTDLLHTVERLNGELAATVDDGDGATQTLRKATQQIAPSGLLDRVDRDHVSLSLPARQWLDTGDAYFLTATFHQHIRFIGEMLHELRTGPMTTNALGAIANNTYQLNWSTLDQVRRRCAWFICLGFIEYKTSQLIGLTEQGEHFCELLLPGLESDIFQKSDVPVIPVVVPETPDHIKDLLEGLTDESILSRNAILGYIPRGNSGIDIVGSLELLVNACIPELSRADLITFAMDKFGTSVSSFGAALTTLTKSGLIEQTGFNIYSATLEAKEWIESNENLNLIRILHSKYLFFLEILPALNEFDRAPDLAKAGRDYYGMPRTDVGGMRTRLQLLKSVGLIEERANWRYQPTPLGEEVAARIHLQKSVAPGEILESTTTSITIEEPDIELASMCREIVAAGTASDAPDRLERVTADAFAYLGFAARHIGGSGKTDVLLTGHDAAGREMRIIVDAKSAKSGVVNEGAIQFDTLTEHKKHHQADLVVLVGPNFDSGRVRQRAEQNMVTLITTPDLANIVHRQRRAPRSLAEFIQLLIPGKESRREFELAWTQYERRVSLLAHVVGVLSEESQNADVVTHGALTSDQIYLITRVELDPKPSPQEIEDVLQLLQHPLLKSVASSNETGSRPTAHHLVDRPNLVSAKLRMLANSLDDLDEASVPDATYDA